MSSGSAAARASSSAAMIFFDSAHSSGWCTGPRVSGRVPQKPPFHFSLSMKCWRQSAVSRPRRASRWSAGTAVSRAISPSATAGSCSVPSTRSAAVRRTEGAAGSSSTEKQASAAPSDRSACFAVWATTGSESSSNAATAAASGVRSSRTTARAASRRVRASGLARPCITTARAAAARAARLASGTCRGSPRRPPSGRTRASRVPQRHRARALVPG